MCGEQFYLFREFLHFRLKMAHLHVSKQYYSRRSKLLIVKTKGLFELHFLQKNFVGLRETICLSFFIITFLFHIHHIGKKLCHSIFFYKNFQKITNQMGSNLYSKIIYSLHPNFLLCFGNLSF